MNLDEINKMTDYQLDLTLHAIRENIRMKWQNFADLEAGELLREISNITNAAEARVFISKIFTNGRKYLC